MGRDVNIKKLKKNAFRYSKHRGETASRVRIPGGVIDAESMAEVASIAEEFGDGTIFLTNRQGIELPGIDMADMPAVNERLQSIIEASGVNQEEPGQGYPASGTRNVVACPGSRLCPFGCYDTTAFARKMDKAIFPDDLHVKIAFTGCSNDCAKVRMDDIGVIGMTEPQYDPQRCVGCEQCVKYCRIRSVNALEMVNGKIRRDPKLCIGCGVCVYYCPTRAWTRSSDHYFRVVIMGRTGKKNPRLAQDFIKWADEDSIMKITENMYAYVREYIDKGALEGKEHIGYIVDRTGFAEFAKWAMEGVTLPEMAEVSSTVYWDGKRYDRSNDLK
ncbi:sulfite reductase subunit C [Eubacterium sp. AB3007]|uniref:sulfite reductase subunit C n=1 Tax=Eubacterium sp. AB3007 TaxID=1392487 RepID=UPI000487324D|nr:sulfite reductase subunit C [Eubacterium sp. AB3007]